MFSKMILASMQEERERPFTNLEKQYFGLRYEQVKESILLRGGDIQAFKKSTASLKEQIVSD